MCSISLNNFAYLRLANYAQKTGQSPAEALQEAINHYMDTYGDCVLDALEKRDVESRSEEHAREYLAHLKKKRNERPVRFKKPRHNAKAAAR
jgi:predicted DNA-binding protein